MLGSNFDLDIYKISFYSISFHPYVLWLETLLSLAFLDEFIMSSRSRYSNLVHVNLQSSL